MTNTMTAATAGIAAAEMGCTFDKVQIPTLLSDTRAIWLDAQRRVGALDKVGVPGLHPTRVALCSVISETDRLIDDAARFGYSNSCDQWNTRGSLGNTASRVLRAVAALDRLDNA